MTLIEFYEDFICLNLNQFENLKLNFEINKFLLVAMVGVICALIAVNYVRSSLYLTVNKLIRHDAIGEENAKTLTELGINIPRVKRLLSGGAQTKALIRRVGEVQLSYEEYVDKMKKKERPSETIDFADARFYIDREAAPKAREISLKSNSLVLNTVLFCVLTVALFACLVLLMPTILGFINNIFA